MVFCIFKLYSKPNNLYANPLRLLYKTVTCYKSSAEKKDFKLLIHQHKIIMNKDKKTIQQIIELLKDVVKLSEVSWTEFNQNESLRKEIGLKLRTVGKLGKLISPRLILNYQKQFFWGLFMSLEHWTIEKNDDVSWDLLKGYSHNGMEYESLKKHKANLEKIFKIEFEQILNSDIKKNKTSTKIIYTPMGNKR